MKTLYTILLEGAASKTKIPISSEHRMPAHLFPTGRHLRPALRTIAAVAVIALMGVLSSAALGANPAEEMAKVGTTDPKGNSWLSIQNSIEQFGHPEFILRLFLSLSLAVACAWAIAWQSAPLVASESAFRFRRAQGAHSSWHGRGGCRRTERDQPNARLCHLRHRRALAISNPARQSETHWESHHGCGGRARVRHGIVGDGCLCYRLHLATRLLA